MKSEFELFIYFEFLFQALLYSEMWSCDSDCFYYCSACWPKITEYISDAVFMEIAKVRAPVRNADTAVNEGGPIAELRTFNVPAAQSVYELTLTTGRDDPLALDAAMKKILKSKMFRIIAYQYAFELTQKGLPHVHAILYSGKRFMDATKMGTFWQERFELKKVISEKHYINYIFKEKNNKLVIDYCRKRKIDQFTSCPLLETQLRSASGPQETLDQENL